MQLQALLFLAASMPTIAHARAITVREEEEGYSKFSGTCRDMSFGTSDEAVLEATCPATALSAGPPTSYNNKLDLNKCIGLGDDGKMVFKADGQFANDCDLGSCSLVTTVLACKCGADKTASTIDLDEGIGNNEGVLMCAGGLAEFEKSVDINDYQ